MRVIVYQRERYGDVSSLFERVAEVDAPEELELMDALEYAYRWTNNINGSWSKGASFEWDGEIHENPDYNPNVNFVGIPHPEGYGHRSTSMGDVMFANGKNYEVAMCGFEELERGVAA